MAEAVTVTVTAAAAAAAAAAQEEGGSAARRCSVLATTPTFRYVHPMMLLTVFDRAL